jgi:hypothetical protein
MRIRLLVLGLLFWTAAVAADGPLATRDAMNGRSWRTLNETGKVYYIVGFNDALRTMSLRSAADLDVYDTQRTMGETVEGVDEIYQKPENVILPVYDAIELFALKSKGVPATQVEEKRLKMLSLYGALERLKRK